MKDSFYKPSAIVKFLGRFAESPVFDDLIFISNLSENEWNKFEKELKKTVDEFLEKFKSEWQVP